MATIQKLPTRNLDPVGPIYENVPGVVPDAGEDLFTSDVHVIQLYFVNPGVGPITVTVKDKQAGPLDVIAPIAIASGKDAAYNFHGFGRLAPGGLNWKGSAGSTVIGYVQARKL